MGIRETINKNRKSVTVVMGAVIVLAAGFCVYQLRAMAPGKPPNKTFFTVDDGKTWFVDDNTRVPPFDHGGQQAVRAMLFYCDSDHKTFVAWMERFTPPMKAKLEKEIEQRAQRIAQGQLAGETFDPESGMQVKRPGGGDWVMASENPNIRSAACADGSQAGLHPLMP